MPLNPDDKPGEFLTVVLAGLLYAFKSKPGPAGAVAPYRPDQAFDEATAFMAEVERRYGPFEADPTKPRTGG